MVICIQAALEFFEGQAMQAGAPADAEPLMDMFVPQVLLCLHPLQAVPA